VASVVDSWVLHEVAAKKWLLHVESGDEEAEDRLSVHLVAGAARFLSFLCFLKSCCRAEFRAPGMYRCPLPAADPKCGLRRDSVE
jgi:hypothetical protein